MISLSEGSNSEGSNWSMAAPLAQAQVLIGGILCHQLRWAMAATTALAPIGSRAGLLPQEIQLTGEEVGRMLDDE
jgi:hypothetical protein